MSATPDASGSFQGWLVPAIVAVTLYMLLVEKGMERLDYSDLVAAVLRRQQRVFYQLVDFDERCGANSRLGLRQRRKRMGTPAIDFWISVGSTYSYLSVMRLEAIEKAAGISFRWRPFSVRSIMIEQNNIPFRGKPVKMAYMWRDVERRAQGYGLRPSIPVPYPLAEFDLANKVAIIGEQEGWCAPYIQATYKRWFEDGQEAGSEPNLSASLREIGQDPDRVITAARSDDIGQRYQAATREAKTLGVFGSPSFAVNGEIFWGDDRLEDAIDWFKGRSRGAASGG